MDLSPMPQPLIVERHVETKISDTTNDYGENVNNFKSRYLTDFEPVDCLGKGAFGMVFEAKNKFDDCNYAIKRIALSNSQDSSVMREVKALAKLEHPNIVRYYNAWLECPPSGWQEEHDQQWLNKSECSVDSILESQTEIQTETINVSQTNQFSVNSACKALKLMNMDANDDSYITFKGSNEKQYDDSICNTYSTDDSDLSLSRGTTEEKLANVNETDHSESIVFEETDNNIVTEKAECKRKSLSLDLNKKPNTRKSTKVFLYIQMQLCQKFTLRKWLKEHTSERDTSEVLNMFAQIVDAVEYVHSRGLIHRDLKPSNICFAYDDTIKVGDFGLVTAMTDNCDTCVGTVLYMSPEIGYQNYDYKVDIYALGIIFFELFTPFSTEMERVETLLDLKEPIFPKNVAISDYFSNYKTIVYNLLLMMLNEDPTKRPTALQIKKSELLLFHENYLKKKEKRTLCYLN